MKIKSNATPLELSSPFYLANEQFCHDFERFIASKQGKVKGVYNAWSYSIYGKIETGKAWDLKYKKATYSGGSIWFSSKYQNLLTLAEWKCHDFGTNDTSFVVRKKKFLDLLNPSFSKVDTHENYVIKAKKGKPRVLPQLVSILKPLFESKEIYKITCKNNTLIIELRNEGHHFDIFNQLIQLS
ncbi:hypothetical protein H2O64_02955 [Kordia sp. YSTF-M3]|uniref:Uncharacterized protein n=1 Tax=Kordia aestuariivivens TaxID=2759037 RepID=A0ABR7Q4Z1_9FLAO|nr:hypothetical protein [Kordia aestuariivivens]MBC8753615.1 hypothetical protein [Kordia aestuariivivens]